MPKADGSVLIITEIDTNGVVKGTKEIKGQLKDIGEESEKSGKEVSGGLSEAFKKLGTAIASAAIVDKLIDVSKQAIELGSDLQEVQNVVDVTFTTMSDKVDEFAKAAAASAGLSETMAKKYVGTFGAMADSFGFAESEALEMSIALTQLSGDLASFYNISQDEAYTKLKSVFTGETESLKELGVVMTQTALDAYAMANGFEKTTSAMTEQEKVALRYQFVMDQLSGASGDFVRTQESWANQSRVLQLQWESLLATIGGSLIEVFTPILGFINEDILPGFQRLADAIANAFEATPSENLNKSLESVGKAVASANDEFEDSAETIEKNAQIADHYRKRLKELEEAGLDTSEAQNQYAAAVAKLNEIYPDLNLEIDEQTGLLKDQWKIMDKNMDAMKKKALLHAQEKQYTAILEAQAEAIIAVMNAEMDLANTQAERERIEKALSEATGMTAEQLINLYNRQNNANNAIRAGGDNAQITSAMMQIMTDKTANLTAEQMALIGQLISLNQEEQNLTNQITAGNTVIAEHDEKLKGMGIGLGTAAEKAGKTADAVENVADAYQKAVDEAVDSISVQVGLFDKLESKSEMTAAEIVQNWRDQQAAFTNYSDNLRKAVDMGLDEALVKQLSDGSKESMLILNELVNGTEMSVDEINAAFRERMQAADLTEIQMAAAQGASAEKLQQMLKDFKEKWPEMSGVVASEVKKIQDNINSISGKTFYIVAETSSGKPGTGGGRDIFPSTPKSASVASVPMLAKGAVIPPSKPFMAILGDQRNGTNIEAPLSTIQEAVAVVMEDMIRSNLAGHEATVAVLREILAAVLGIEIGDSVIGEAVERYNREMAVIRGG